MLVWPVLCMFSLQPWSLSLSFRNSWKNSQFCCSVCSYKTNSLWDLNTKRAYSFWGQFIHLHIDLVLHINSFLGSSGWGGGGHQHFPILGFSIYGLNVFLSPMCNLPLGLRYLQLHSCRLSSSQLSCWFILLLLVFPRVWHFWTTVSSLWPPGWTESRKPLYFGASEAGEATMGFEHWVRF